MSDSEFSTDLANLALEIGREAGALAHNGQDQVRVEDTKSSPSDVVTQMDRACESHIRTRLAGVRPDDDFIGEESGASESLQSGAVRWIVDPIDGTVNYVYGLPNWAVSIAAERDGEVLAGVVVAPALGVDYIAVRGQGSYALRGGQKHRLQCSRQDELSMALVATGFGYRRARRVEQARVVSALLPEIRDIRRLGAAALDLCAVGAGLVDVYYERGLNPWDLAAGGLVASEAGAVVSGLRGKPASDAMTLAAPAALCEQLERRLVELEADRGDSAD